ncbi:MAG TPA: SUMF1/EgtB/PvdO family nonheme iron enzyme [Steroidobacteraceae bacterium]|jgi:cytochrome oxidase Cu insertion factor (SCO1/SenC/PrrC family)|nr:SUMF1/EgtB/PvdO family nonheme iron enzyme [Steroidobacteraceae bacterium]
MRRAFAAPALLLGAISLAAEAGSANDTARVCPSPGHPDEVFIPAGVYTPFFKSGSKIRAVRVAPICLGASPVSHEEFLGFLRDHPQWRKSRIKTLFAENSYLADWQDDFTPQPGTLSHPVTFVSWFAAGAYCEARGGRLPTVAEWERFGGADQPANDRGAAPFEFAMGRRAPELADTPLVFPGVWEWTANFNSALVSGRIGTEESADSSQFCGDGIRAVNPANYAAFLRYSFRSSLRANFALKNLGFRCAREVPDDSVYLLDSAWVEDSGHSLQLRELEGDFQVLALIYTTCTGSCPVTVKALQMFSRHLPVDIKKRTRFLLVTVDPEHDTLAALRQYRRDMKLDQTRWKLLRGSPADVRELAAVLGFNYEQIDSGQFAHSNLVTVLDRRGHIIHQQNDGAANSDELIDAIRQPQNP